MKKKLGFIFIFFVLVINAFGETEIDKTVSQIKKDFEITDFKRNFKVENSMENSTYTTYNFIQNNNIKKYMFGYYKDNTETYEEYYLKDNKINLIFTEKTKQTFDDKNKNVVKIEKETHKYYFDNNQKLIRYVAPNENIYDGEKIPSEIRIKVEELKKNIAGHLNEKNSKDTINEMKKEFDEANKEMMKKFDEMKKEMDSFFEKF